MALILTTIGFLRGVSYAFEYKRDILAGMGHASLESPEIP